MSQELQNQEWYTNLVDECQAIITEAVFTSRWALVEGHWSLGQRIRGEGDKVTKLLTDLSVKIKVSERDLWRSLSLYDKYPDINKIPEGKNITWNKLITKYLTVPEEQEKKAEEECSHEKFMCCFCKKVFTRVEIQQGTKAIPDSELDKIVKEQYPKEWGNPDINQIIASYTRLYGHPPTRQPRIWSKHLISNLKDVKKVLVLLEFAASIQGQEYAPKIGSLKDLYYKIDDLRIYWKKHQQRRNDAGIDLTTI